MPATRKRKSATRQSGRAPAAQGSMRPRARLLSLLGEQLIGNDQLAVFELVKNAYDADASKVTVSVGGLDTNEPTIVVVDDGEGMSADTLLHVWLEPGNDHRQSQRENKTRSPKFKRLPLGEKGVGRFAVHKLGNRIKLTTRKANGPELSLDLDWNQLISKKYLADTRIKIFRNKPFHFPGTAHGTRIEISDLKRTDWTRGDIRKLQRLITAIDSPFSDHSSFSASLEVPERKEWLRGIPSVHELVDSAPWRFEFRLDQQGLWYSYSFKPPVGIKVEPRQEGASGQQLLLPSKPGSKNKVVSDVEMLKGIGPISGTLVAFDKDPKIRRLLPQISLLDDFLEHWSGIRVYRDDIRIFNYGEPDDDWLGLDLRRVNRPTERLSRNIVIGAVNLSLEESFLLREKTNREGFDENAAYETFKTLVLAAVSKFEIERALDKDRLKRAVEGTKNTFHAPVEYPLAELRTAIHDAGMDDKLLRYVDKVEHDYHEVKELMLKTGMAGLNLAVVFHEAERGVRSLYQAIRKKHDPSVVELQASALMLMFEDISGLLRKRSSKRVSLRETVQTAVRLAGRRFERHQVHASFDLLPDDDIAIQGSAELVLGALTNLIDNALYWLRVRWPEVPAGAEYVRQLHIKIVREPGEGAALVLADNGPGIKDDPEVLVRPFFSRRPDGMGLGLYYSSMAMQLNGGNLMFGDAIDVDLPQGLDGAVISMFFPEGRLAK
jgi:signal transduction histidine kinase